MRDILTTIVAIASLSTVVLLIWYFSGVFTQKKTKRICIVVIIVIFGVFLYIQSRPKVIHMKEDVLYVKPMSENDIK